MHADGVVHHHENGGGAHKDSQGQSHVGDCCWLFYYMSALARHLDVTFGVFSGMNHSVPDSTDALYGRDQSTSYWLTALIERPCAAFAARGVFRLSVEVLCQRIFGRALPA